MLKINRYQKIILRDLYRAGDVLNAYTFYRRYKFDIAFLINVTSKLVRLELIRFQETMLKLTDRGKDLICTQNIISKDENEKPWLIIPDEFKGFRVRPWEPYIPSRRLLDQKLFKI
jgi:hypothetical protein